MAVREVVAPAVLAPTLPGSATEAVAHAPGTATLADARGQAVLATFTSAHFSHHVITSLLNPMMPFIRDAFAINYAQSGFLVSAFSMSMGISNAPIGMLADRFGSRPVIAVGLLLTGGISIALAFAQAYWQLFALLITLGVIAGTYHAPAAAIMARIFDPKVRGAAMGFHITGGHFSFFITPIIAAWLVAGSGDWRTPYQWLAIAPLLLGVAVWYLSPRDPAHQATGVSRLAVFREVGTVLRTVGPLVTASILFQMMWAAIFAFTTLYFVDVRGMSATTAAMLFGIPNFVGIAGAPLGGFISDRMGRRAVILFAVGLLGPAMLLLTQVPNELIWVPLGLAGIATSMRMAVTETLVLESAPSHRRATIVGSYHMITQELGGLAAPLVGLLAAAVGIGLAFSSITTVLAAASIAVVLLRNRL
ncbi:MAG: MFS transporter [Chloroflexota bacterium]